MVKFQRKLFLLLLILPVMAVFVSTTAWAAPAVPIIYTIVQPDGTKFQARSRGDEWNNWTATKDDYTIVKDEDSGYWVYVEPGFSMRAARVPARSVQLHKSFLKVGIDAPVGIEKNLIPKATTINPNTLNNFSQSSASRGPIIPLAPPLPGTGNHNVLVILVNFSDKTLTTTETEWANRFFGATASVKDYYNEVSYGNLNIVPAAESYGTANNGVVAVNVGYAHPNTGGSTGDTNRQLTKDALTAADSYVNFASFDSNSSGALSTSELHIVIIAAGYEGAFGACSPSVWGHRWALGWGAVLAPTLDGVIVGDWYKYGGYTQFGELQGFSCASAYLATIGVMVHELGHDLWLPDEYDTDGSSEGIGNWGVMGGGAWNYANGLYGDSPAHPTAWDKWYESWLTPTRITGSSTVSIPQVETSPTVYQLLDNPGGVDWSFEVSSGTGEYFLVENRQQTGYDAGLPGCGILIWHIDETVTSGNSANTSEWGQRLIALEQADGAFHLEYKTNRGDTNDPYTSEKTFNNATTPNSNLYNGSASGVSITVNSNCGTNMSVTMTAPPCPYSISPSSAEPSACGGTGSVSVTTQSGCSWVATSSASWITITSGSTGTGDGTVNYSVTANTGSLRIGTLTIAGQTFTVTQSGIILSVSVNPSSWDIGTIPLSGIRLSTISDNIIVSNTGTCNETFTLSVSSSGPSWSPDESKGEDTYVLWGLFCGSTDDPTDPNLFTGDDIILSGPPVTATDTQFGDTSLTDNGANVAPNDSVDLWFQFQAPTQSADKNEQSIIVTIGAEQAL